MNWISSAIGLGGVGLAMLTLLLTYRSRLSPYQQQLYERQLDAATDVLQALGAYHDEAVRFFDESGSARGVGADNLAKVKSDFFLSYRRWNVVIPQPVTEAVTAYMQVLERISTTAQERSISSEPHHDSPGYRLANAYAAVLGAAQRELRVKTLSDKTLSLIESLSRDSIDPTPSFDPLYVKAVAERHLFESFVNEATVARSPRATDSDGTELPNARSQFYTQSRNLFLIHAWRPSDREGQLADISIRIVEHGRQGPWPKASHVSPERPITDRLIEKVEYYLGSSFGPAFLKYNAAKEFRLDISAYGATLCIARVHFNDGRPPVILYRYLDFMVPDESALAFDEAATD